MAPCDTVIVKFPDGDKEVTPIEWTRNEDSHLRVGTLQPVFDIPGYNIIQCIDGSFIAVKDNT